MMYWVLYLCGTDHYAELVVNGSPFMAKTELVKRFGKAILINWKRINAFEYNEWLSCNRDNPSYETINFGE